MPQAGHTQDKTHTPQEISMAYQSINPNTGKLLKSFEQLTEAQLEKSLAAADNCFRTWWHKTYAERAVIVNKAAALMHAHVDDFATGDH
jgi:succinate-semialdehyde dehydrogenase/glutarate-semialdehyde dehydrogenase